MHFAPKGGRDLWEQRQIPEQPAQLAFRLRGLKIRESTQLLSFRCLADLQNLQPGPSRHSGGARSEESESALTSQSGTVTQTSGAFWPPLRCTHNCSKRLCHKRPHRLKKQAKAITAQVLGLALGTQV